MHKQNEVPNIPFERAIGMQPNGIQSSFVRNKLKFPVQFGLQNIINLQETSKLNFAESTKLQFTGQGSNSEPAIMAQASRTFKRNFNLGCQEWKSCLVTRNNLTQSYHQVVVSINIYISYRINPPEPLTSRQGMRKVS